MDETYDAVENRTRVYKKEAHKLIKEAEQAGRLEMDMRKRKDGNTSPRKPRASPKKNMDLHGWHLPPSAMHSFETNTV